MRPRIEITGPEAKQDPHGDYWSVHASGYPVDDGPVITVLTTWPTEPDRTAINAALVEAITRLAGWDDAEVVCRDAYPDEAEV